MGPCLSSPRRGGSRQCSLLVRPSGPHRRDRSPFARMGADRPYSSLIATRLSLLRGDHRRQVFVALDLLLTAPFAAGQQERRRRKQHKTAEQGAQITL